MSRGPAAVDPLVRLMRRVQVDPESECWIWTGAIGASTGYGRIRMGSRVDDTVRTELTHRLSYELHKGPIPEGLVLDHLCRVRACCNPSHLEPVTVAENIRRGEAGPRDTCYRRHPVERQAYRAGVRRCLDCAAIRSADSRARKDGRMSNSVYDT